MEKHVLVLEASCRICGKQTDKQNRLAVNCVENIQAVWQVNVLLDSPNVHPRKICNKCRSICMNQKYNSGKVKSSVLCITWVAHTAEHCEVCISFPLKVQKGRKRKRNPEQQYTTGTKTNDDESTDSDDGRYSHVVESYSILMDNVRDSLARIPQKHRQQLVSELAALDNVIVIKNNKESKLSFMTSSLGDGINISSQEFVSALDIEQQKKITYEIFKSQSQEIARDAQSFSQTYKDIELIRNLDRAEWLRRRNKIVMSAVEGLSTPAITEFQKCLFVEHLYSLVLSESLVLPFSFLVNLLLFTVTNSKLALNITGRILPGGQYATVTRWRANLASVPVPFPDGDVIVAFDNDQIVQKKWKVKAGQKTSIFRLTLNKTMLDSRLITGTPTVTKAPPHQQQWVRNRQMGGGAYTPCEWIVVVKTSALDSALALINARLKDVEEGESMEAKVDEQDDACAKRPKK